MSRKAVVVFSLVALMLLGTITQAGAGNPTAPLSTLELKKSIGLGKKTIVFFLNPNGGPCKAQNEILVKLQKDKKNNFTLAYVSAMEQQNQQAFYDYGVRSLPSLVLVDSSGKIGRVFPPGIQTYEALATALDGIK